MSGGIGPVAATTPYPWPWDGGCAGDRLALVVAGWDAGWRARADAGAVAAVEDLVGSLAAGVDAVKGLVVTVGHLPPAARSGDADGEPWRDRLAHAVSGASGAGEVTALGVPAPASVYGISRSSEISRTQNWQRRIGAAGVDGFHGSGLDAALRAAGVTHLLVAGHGLEGPVHSTLRSANDRGYECLLVVDACSPLVPDLAAAARSMVEMSGGIFGAVGVTADVLAALVAEPARLTT